MTSKALKQRIAELVSVIAVVIRGLNTPPPEDEKLKYLDIVNQIQLLCKYTRNDDIYMASQYLYDAIMKWHFNNTEKIELKNDLRYKKVIDAIDELKQVVERNYK